MATFEDYVTRRFIGQERRIPELDILMKEANSGTNMNILLKAQSGHGKTMLGSLMVQYLDPEHKDSFYYIPNKEGTINFQKKSKIHLIDEVHLLKPPELIYDYLSSNKYIIILATNESFKLAEPIRNRCYEIEFLPYSLEDLYKITNITFVRKRLQILENISRKIATYGRGNPRVLIKLTERLAFIFKQEGIPSTEEKLTSIIWDILHIKTGGITELDSRYLNFLKTIGGVASLKTLSGGTNIPTQVIANDIEPFLMSKSLIRITSKGRVLI